MAVSQSQPGRVMMGKAPGVFLSDDRGDHWQLVHVTPTSLGPNALAIDPVDASILYAGGRNFPQVPPIERSLDGGLTWSDASSGIGPNGTTELVIDPLQTSRIYAVVDDRLYRTTDGSLSWTALTLPFQNSFGVPLAASPAVPSRLYALGESSGVWRSDNAGDGWTLIAPIWGDEILINGAQPDEMFIQGSRLWRSADAGATWALIDTPSTGVDLGSLALTPGDPPTLLLASRGHLYKSTDRGATWQVADTGVHGVSIGSFAVAPGSQEPLVYAAGGGLFRRTAAGWNAVPMLDSEGHDLRGGGAVALEPGAPTTLYVLCGVDVCKSTDGGQVWTALGAPDWDANEVAVHPQRPQTVFVGGVEALLRSTDGGASWVEITQGLPLSPKVRQIVFDPDDPDRMLIRDSRNRLYLSLDGGGSFQQLSLPFVCQWLVAVPLTPATLFAAATSLTEPVWKSIDGGANWTPIPSGSGLPPSGGWALAASPSDPSDLYLQMSNGLFFHSPDAGATWYPLPPGPALDPLASSPQYYTANALSVGADPADTLWMGGFGFSVYEYTGQVFRDGFESGDLSGWDVVVGSAVTLDAATESCDSLPPCPPTTTPSS